MPTLCFQFLFCLVPLILPIQRPSDVFIVLTKLNRHHASLQAVTARSATPARYCLLGSTAGTETSKPRLLQCSQHGSRDVSPHYFCKEVTRKPESPILLTCFAIPSLLERAQGDVWCAPNTKTWVSIEFGKKMASTIVTELLIDSFNMISDTTQANGDGPIVKGQFLFTRYGLAFAANNANNHQLTREVLKGAITAVWQYMRNRQYHLGGQGLVKFQIFDGVNQVGTGSIKTAPSG